MLGVSLGSAQGPTWLLAKATGSEAKPLKGSWSAVYTRPRHEKIVQARLTSKQIHSFLPVYLVQRRWGNGVRRAIQHPLFPGYVFVCLGVADRLPVLQTSGILHIVGNGSSSLSLDDCVMEALRIAGQNASLMPHPFLCAADTYQIARGPFRGLKGHVEKDGGDPTFVVSIRSIRSSFSIRVHSNDLELIGSSPITVATQQTTRRSAGLLAQLAIAEPRTKLS